MSDLRNPFRLRAANRLERDDTFVSLFGPGVLDILDDGALQGPPRVLRSAPGGGKTSLMRLFTPPALWVADRRKDTDPTLFQRLEAIGALGDHGPAVLGVMLAVGRDVATLDDLPLDATLRRRLFLALFTAKLIIETVRAAAALPAADPVAFSELMCLGPSDGSALSGLTFPCTGEAMLRWASEQEEAIGRALDTYPFPAAPPGQDSLSVIRALSADRIHYRGRPIASRSLLMFDDLQNLARAQRRALLDDLSTGRYPPAIWLSERLAALDEQELLDVGAVPQRDFHTVVLEDVWISRNAAHRRALEDIASRRAKLSGEPNIPEFSPCLEDRSAFRLDGMAETSLVEQWRAWYAEQLSSDRRSRHVVAGLLGTDHVIKDWESLVKVRAAAIMAERDRTRQQSTFEFAVDQPVDSDVKAAAELFLCIEGKLPYYYGFDAVTTLSSGNIDQFLDLAGDLFERLTAKWLRRKQSNLTPQEQHDLVRAAAERKLDNLSQYVPRAVEVKRLLVSLGQACSERTRLPNAPYSPGVTGVGVRLREWAKLKGGPATMTDIEQSLRSVLHAATVHNLIEVSAPQRCKGEEWVIVRLNRLLCPQFFLPLQRGQWRPTTLKELGGWTARGFIAPPKGMIAL